jgi:hypothetical protein
MLRNPDRLAVVGPISPDNRFPLWCKDSQGVRLGLALDPGDPLAPAIGELPVPGAPLSFPDNFPDEAFYSLVEARMTTGGTAAPGRARVVLALEAAFGGTGEVIDGQQMVFGRVRVRIDGGVPGAAYRFTHPYGQTDPLIADEDGRVFVTEDIGAVPLAFAAALDSQVAPFLRWTSGAELAPGEIDPPAGYLGDGTTDHTITGSPLGFNFVRIEGPGIADAGGPRDPEDPTNPDKILTRLFTVQGRLATVTGVDVPRSVYSRPASGDLVVDVFGRSEPGQVIEVGGAGISSTRMRSQQDRYLARITATALAPAEVTATNLSDVPPTVTTSPVTDAVTITQAEYDLDTRTLTIAAASSDEVTAPVLTATDFGELTSGDVVFTDVDAPPATVEVRSANGGSARLTVTVVGAALPPLPVTADAGPDLVVQQGQTVTLDGTGSSGGVTGFSWMQTSGPAVVLADPAAASTTFTAPDAGTALSFGLTVDGPGSPVADSVDVTVAALTAPVANAGPDLSAGVGAVVVLDGSASLGAAERQWQQLSGPAVVLSDTTAARPTFTMPAGAVAFRLTVAGPGGAPSTDDVEITAVPDTLDVQTSQFRTSKLQWRISGTASGALPDRVEVRFGSELVGVAQVDPTAAWDVRRTVLASEPALRPTPGASITVVTSRGGSRTEPVNIRS